MDATFDQLIGGSLFLCDPAVGKVSVGSQVPVSCTATKTGIQPILFGLPIGPETDTITGVITQVAANGTAQVVALLSQTTVSLAKLYGQGSSVVLNMQSQTPLAASLAGQTLHVAIGSQSLFNYKVGQAFYADPAQMLRTEFVVPGTSSGGGVGGFALQVRSISTPIAATAKASATITVTNTGSASAVDAITGVTTDQQGNVIGNWTAVHTPLIAAGGMQVVSLAMETAPGSAYAGDSLTVTFSDDRGNSATVTVIVQSTGGTGQPPTPSPSPSPSSIPWPAIAGVGLAGLGAIAISAAIRKER